MSDNKIYYKRPMDIAASSLGLVALSPVFLAIAAAVKIDDKGPAIFKQKRLTKDGKVFEIYKFRTMKVNAEDEGPTVHNEADDERVTGVGRFLRKSHLDELPQLWNVLRGDMSIVGPRPELPELTELYCKDVPGFRDRLQAKAGLTGYAQVYCKNNDDPAEKLKYDLEYIANMRLAWDVKIIFATFKMVLLKNEPNSKEANRMSTL